MGTIILKADCLSISLFHIYYVCEYNKITVILWGECMRRRRNGGLGIILVSFGIGLFIACCFPSSFLVAVIALAIILIGFFICKL